MTRYDIFRMAHEAGILQYGYPVGERVAGELERFADLIAEAEREACAKVCEATMTDAILGGNKEYNTGREMGATVCANKIRMRSNA